MTEQRSTEARTRKVVFRHRVVLEFETTVTTGYNGDVEYLVKHARAERYRYVVTALPRTVKTADALKDITGKPPVIIKEQTTVVSVEVDA